MAERVANVPSVRSTVVGYTTAKGWVAPATNTNLTTANVPYDNATVLIGADVVSFKLPANGKQTLFFQNLPKRSNSPNPLNATQTSQSPFTVNPQDTLLFVVTPQSSNVAVAVDSFGQTSAFVQAPGPFLGSETYTGFGVNVSGSIGASGMIVGLLFMTRGTQ